MRIDGHGAPFGAWRVALAMLGLALTAPTVQAQSLESVLAPGVVSEAHAKVEHECKACHSTFDRGAQSRLCIACHKDVGDDIRQHAGLHGRRPAGEACRSCHTEHRGRGAQLAVVDTKTFDHRATDFELRDKHTAVACAKCHVAGKRWREAGRTCVACHAADDVHKGGLGRRCDECHAARGWREAAFDHDKQTRYPLVGKHAEAKCADCHVQGRYKDTPRTCIACHRKDDSHKGQYGEKCEACHASTLWKSVTFNHDTDTRFRLVERHRGVKCAACHTGPLYQAQARPGTACIDCHAKDDQHQQTLGRQCANCHSERGWKATPGFDHARSDFPLLGGHARAACKDCHVDARYRQTPKACIDCHRKDDRHEGNLGTACADCHREDDWKLARTRFDHARTRFPLRHAHAAPGVKCQDCHETLKSLRGTETACVSCHRRDDRHAGTLDARCDACHDDQGWRIARFDHGRSRFALVGRHLVVGCNACHTSLRFKEAPGDCLACHRKDDVHKGSLGAACAGCHNARAWPLWEFDHDRASTFALEGRHRELRCAACHAQAAPAGRAIAALGSECVACHRKDDRHEGRFGRRCEQCHAAQDWRRLRSTAAPMPAQAR